MYDVNQQVYVKTGKSVSEGIISMPLPPKQYTMTSIPSPQVSEAEIVQEKGNSLNPSGSFDRSKPTGDPKREALLTGGDDIEKGVSGNKGK